MKKLIVCASALALAACGGQADTEAEDAAAMEEPVEEAASAVIPGTYDLTYADGTTGTVTISDDGTYSGTQGDETGSGTVTDVDGKACFDQDGDDAGPVCWTASDQAEDGSFTSTSDDGTVVKVTPAAAEAEAEG